MVGLPVRGRFGQGDSIATQAKTLRIGKLHDTRLDKADRQRIEYSALFAGFPKTHFDEAYSWRAIVDREKNGLRQKFRNSSNGFILGCGNVVLWSHLGCDY